jgi:hypothetical protein
MHKADLAGRTIQAQHQAFIDGNLAIVHTHGRGFFQRSDLIGCRCFGGDGVDFADGIDRRRFTGADRAGKNDLNFLGGNVLLQSELDNSPS